LRNHYKRRTESQQDGECDAIPTREIETYVAIDGYSRKFAPMPEQKVDRTMRKFPDNRFSSSESAGRNQTLWPRFDSGNERSQRIAG
jgi:hypothetical protein